MPGSVQNAAPATVLPKFLCSQFEMSREWAVYENEYLNGERQTTALTTTPRRSWSLVARVSASDLTALRAFLYSRRWIEPFYFYDGTETSPKWSHDPTGVVTTGRYTVVARGRWVQSKGIARGSAEVQLVEVT